MAEQEKIMDAPFLKTSQPNLEPLKRAIATNKSEDTLGRFMPSEAWDALAPYLSQERIEKGHVLISQGALDRTLYFIESGILRVHYDSHDSELQVALLGPGAVVGEGAFFSEIPRNATVQATQSVVLWALTPWQFERIVKKDPGLALKLSMALGAVLSTRMLDVSHRIAIT